MSKRGKIALVIREGDIRTMADGVGYALTADQVAEVCECVRADEGVWIALTDAVQEIIEGMDIEQSSPVG